MKKIFLLIMFIGAVTSVNAQNLSGSITLSQVTCNGQCNGVISVNATGGTGNYTYELYNASGTLVATSNSSTFTNLCASNFTVHIKDSNNNEYVTSSVMITEPSALVLTNTVTQEPSNGNNDGQIILSAAGGVPSYEYSIDGGGVFTSSNIFSNLSIGTYVFTVRDQLGCFSTNEVVLESSIPDTDTDGDGENDAVDLDDDNDGNPDATDPNPLIPVVVDNILTVIAGTVGVVDVLANDDFLPGADTSLSVVPGAGTTAGGTIIFDSLTGEMNYTPAAGEEGTMVTVEYQVCNTAVTPSVCETATVTITVEVDTDGDGVIDIVDLDDDNDGISDAAEGTEDTDADGVPDYLDLDTDNDGVLDVDEGGNGALDTNSDGVIDLYDAGFSDADGDGQADESISANEEPDTDGDGVPNYKDLDSDNDGINDVIEDGNIDANNDGQSDGTDLDGDGILESVDADESGFGEGINGEPDNTDADSDGVPNYQDLDSDDDGVNDVVEGGDEDADGNGLIDGVDTDGDGILDIVDQDSSSFGDAGNIDFNSTDPTDPDSGGNGVVSDSGTDIDGDGIADSVDGDDSVFGDKKDIDTGNKSEVKGYPNPSSKEINLPQKAEGKTYEIFNSLGIVIKKGIVSDLKINIKEMNNGIYFLKIKGYNSYKLIKG